MHGACWRKQKEEARPPERVGWVGLDPDGRDCGLGGGRERQQVLDFEHRPNTARSGLSLEVTLKKKKNLFLKISCHNKIRSHMKSHSLAMLGPYFQMAVFSRPPTRPRRLSSSPPSPPTLIFITAWHLFTFGFTTPRKPAGIVTTRQGSQKAALRGRQGEGGDKLEFGPGLQELPGPQSRGAVQSAVGKVS